MIPMLYDTCCFMESRSQAMQRHITTGRVGSYLFIISNKTNTSVSFGEGEIKAAIVRDRIQVMRIV